MLVEVCCNSLKSAINAERAGADRIELCMELGVGGITPSSGLLTMVKRKLSVPVHVLIRPRSGHFTYSENEFEVMEANIEYCKKIGVQGIVAGVLLENHQLDVERTKQLVELSKPLHFTFHRAFDWVQDSKAALIQLEKMGVSTILTSGKQRAALDGIEALKRWQGSSKIEIMAGGGVNAENARLFKDAGLGAIHLSGTTFGNTVNVNGKIPMNSERHLEEYHVAVTNAEVIRQTIQQVK